MSYILQGNCDICEFDVDRFNRNHPGQYFGKPGERLKREDEDMLGEIIPHDVIYTCV